MGGHIPARFLKFLSVFWENVAYRDTLLRDCLFPIVFGNNGSPSEGFCLVRMPMEADEHLFLRGAFNALLAGSPSLPYDPELGRANKYIKIYIALSPSVSLYSVQCS